MKPTNGLPDYLLELPDAYRSRFIELSATVRSSIGTLPDSVVPFAFLPNQTDHPEWEDAADVFWRATEELYRASPRRDRELPLFYWGFDSFDVLGRRSSNGVLLTDQAVYVRDVPNATVAIPLADLPTDSTDIDGTVLTVGGAPLDLAPASKLLQDATALESAAVLSVVITALRLAALADPLTEPARDATIADRIQSSTNSDEFLLPSRASDTKKLAKLAAKWKIADDEEILFAWVSATFMGFYGLAMTGTAVYSKDLLDAVVRTERSDIAPSAIHWLPESKEFALTPSHRIPVLPSITDDNRDYFMALLGELLELEQ